MEHAFAAPRGTRMMRAAQFGEAEIRPVLRSRLSATSAGEGDAVVLEELGLCRGRVRVDVALVNGLLHGYEIKSDRDSLRRLGGQVALYGKVLDRATLVVGDRHLDEALTMIPAWWGVLRVERSCQGPCFETLRRARENPARDPRALVELLWLDDALALLERRQLARGVRGKPRRVVWDRICAHLHLDEIAAAVRASLRARAATPGRPSPS